MSEEKFMTFKDYLKVIKKLSKITDELEEMDWKVLRIQYPELNDPTAMSLYYRKLSRYLRN